MGSRKVWGKVARVDDLCPEVEMGRGTGSAWGGQNWKPLRVRQITCTVCVIIFVVVVLLECLGGGSWGVHQGLSRHLPYSWYRRERQREGSPIFSHPPTVLLELAAALGHTLIFSLFLLPVCIRLLAELRFQIPFFFGAVRRQTGKSCWGFRDLQSNRKVCTPPTPLLPGHFACIACSARLHSGTFWLCTL